MVGPMRWCIPLISLRSNQIISITATSRKAKAVTALASTNPTSTSPIGPFSIGSAASTITEAVTAGPSQSRRTRVRLSRVRVPLGTR